MVEVARAKAGKIESHVPIPGGFHFGIDAVAKLDCPGKIGHGQLDSGDVLIVAHADIVESQRPQ